MTAHQKLLSIWHDYNALSKAGSLMSWDQQIFMPVGGAQARAEHTARLSRMAHTILVSDELLRALEDAEKEAPEGSVEAADCRALRRDVSTQTKIPGSLVERKSRATNETYLTWREARANSDFAAMLPHYEVIFELNREIAQCLGYTDHPYDPLHDMYEEGATYASTKALFDAFKTPLKEVATEAAARATTDTDFLVIPGSADALKNWATEAVQKIGFDMNRGRLDLTSNAFCTTISLGDVRMTSRAKDHVSGVILSSLHEMGHALYEQNIPQEWDRRPVGGGVSLGLHESQSRLWENIVGRSPAFWSFFYPRFVAHLPALNGVSEDRFVRALNCVKPGPVRIGSDEINYNLHIILRFELECEIMTGALSAKDLNDAWNAKTEELLGITPANSGEGVLQDVHWARGSIGYFPTYAMGNLIGWQMWECLERDLGDTQALFAEGNFAPILGWLTDKVYSQGKLHRPADLVQQITGSPMRHDAFIRGMRQRYLG